MGIVLVARLAVSAAGSAEEYAYLEAWGVNIHTSPIDV